jgi:NADH dehydrogenase
MNDFLRDALNHYPELDATMLRVVLVHAGDVVLPELGPRLGCYTQEKLQSRGIELRLGARVSGYEDWVVILSTGKPIPANTLVWTGWGDARTGRRSARGGENQGAAEGERMSGACGT